MTSILPPSASDPDDLVTREPVEHEPAHENYIRTERRLSLPVLIVITVSVLVVLVTVAAAVLSSL